jgi:hypothetical protein
MATYKFEQFNIEIVNPTIEINPIVKEINPIDLTINVDIKLTDDSGSKFGISLEKVKVQNLTYTAETLEQRIMEHLKQYEV